ncbi:hypothetical protein Q31b_23010 [Novipirellula aureliae]|uniref:Uncharacterized protein n=1 Tax=Novipirellula aureliae TaxID=2527966 RepID=A0A5C6E0P6_9BACT|nr:hypothetical protein Q31b_23010 [Novipirellula aureliae]
MEEMSTVYANYVTRKSNWPAIDGLFARKKLFILLFILFDTTVFIIRSQQ